MKNLIRLLNENKSVNDYRIAEKKTLSYELFFVHKKLETVRSTDTAAASVTVYVDHDGKRGDSTFAYHASMTEEEITEKIKAAAYRASLSSNQPYGLPEGGEYEKILPGNVKDHDPIKLGAMIADAVYAADTEEGGSINALEIFIYNDTTTVINSKGVNKTQKGSRVMIEAIPTFTDEKQSVELYEDYRFTEFDAAKITAEIKEKMKEVKDRCTAKKPGVPLTVDVMLRPKEIESLMRELSYDLGYASVYMHANLHKIGDDLQPGDCADKITLIRKGAILGSERSAFFDEDGLDLTDTAIIENGVVKANFGSSRFGQYLGVEHPTGNLPCMQLLPGTMKTPERPFIECVSMSGIQLDLYNDYIGGEIRLAYYFDGEKTYPVTGITMSGKLSEVLAKLRMSEKTDISGAYEGPSCLLLKDMTVL